MDLEPQFDVVIIGTGLAESILSAACSRIGKTVLHLDNNSFYGESWASFSFEQLVEWLRFGRVSDALYFHSAEQQAEGADAAAPNVAEPNAPEPNAAEQPQATGSGQTSVAWSDFYKTISNIEIISYLISEQEQPSREQPAGQPGEQSGEQAGEQSSEQSAKWWTTEEFKKLSRKFNIDLCPKLLFATGSMVRLLVTSNISRYMSFKSVTRILCNKEADEQLELIQVPHSRQTIFLSSSISLIEKRLLMKFIQFCEAADKNVEQIKDFVDKPFADLMTSKGLTPLLQRVVLQCVLFTNNNDILVADAMPLIKKFVDSSGRYGPTPFLTPLYGSGEIPQSFCRLSAVFAGTFLLNNTIERLLINKPEGGEESVELVYRNKHIKTQHLISSIDSTPKRLINSDEKSMVSRGIFITDRSVKLIEDENSTNREITLVCLDFGGAYRNVYLLELSSTLCVCPDGFYLVYLWTDSLQSTAKQDLLPIVKKLFNFSSRTESAASGKPNIVWSCYFNSEYVNATKNSNLFANHRVLSNAYNELDYDRTISEARDVFLAMFPDEEFLPRAPEPDEIVYAADPRIDEQENGVREDDPME